jgi:putative transposase
MDRGPKGWHSRGYLPHFDSPEKPQHVVFRTADSLPAEVLAELPSDAGARVRAIDRLLDLGHGLGSLQDPANACLVESAIRHFEGVRYELLAWCIMPDHVHVVIETFQDFSLSDVVRSWKTFTSRRVTRHPIRPGRLWSADYFDRYMRNEEHLAQTIAYVEGNPVRAGLCVQPRDWPWSSARLRR